MKKLSKILDNDVSLILSDAHSYQQVIISIVKHFSSKKKSGFYIALNKPPKTLMKSFSKNRINTSRLVFLDVSYNASKTKNIIPISSAQNLSGISIALNKNMKKSHSFLIFDTVDTFLESNQKNTVEHFFRNIITNMREKNVKVILVGIKDLMTKDMLDISLEKLSDATLDIVTKGTKFEKIFTRL